MKGKTWLIPMLLPHWRRVFLALLLSTLTVTSHIGLMATAAYLLARAALHPPVLDLMVTIVGVRFFGITRAVSRYVERYVSHDVTFRILSEIRVKFYQSIEPLAPARLRNLRSADLLRRIVADVETQQNLFLRVLAPPLVAVLVLTGYGLFLARFDLRFSAILAAGFLMAGLIIPWIFHILSKGIGGRVIALKAKLMVRVADGLMGITELIAYGQAESYLKDVREINEQLRKEQRRSAWLSALSSAITGMAANLSMVLVLILGIVLVEKGRLSGVNLGMLALGTLSSFEALFPLALVPHHLEESRAAANRLLEMLEAEPAVKDQASLTVNPQEMSLAFHDVCFKYDEKAPWALDHVSFSIPRQGKVGIVGASGAGKTSVVNLLLRFWDYNEGRIELGGHSIRDYSQDEACSLIGVVTQRTHIFNATIRENLLLAKPEAGDEELVLACKRAKLHDFIQTLPKGYESFVGEGGFKLSGGQRQRLAIARVFLKNAPILILDEAMEGLDPITEAEVMAEVDRLMEGRTTLVITHHLAGLESMDEIIVLDQGRVVERGKHSELIQYPGFYHKLWDRTFTRRVQAHSPT
ncbi:cysteine export CydDC family ABC transporter permease subunit/ATP-binding protein CydC [Desulfosporosinus orientis DSM 765]|uniref:Cysteine export CydDC family ABC transporter permease subunit/ATP-binding protein CydC n=1 Tax=Desulfosporosinus orientis (strain ATCC 19365 / DSM 765 / NCIMB 8382 / VKM B-1628 / Singapore I) TaxID=768706 RepID=G7WDC0_DESOD|nr:thiol reductant ABC exporter subunit CydC [Desulfosporosinus orientis]AET67605.1 cysteine export CydDC family ABC transporter permease subunit/ATP-binding protein CydC [Desulfosporosinus orientis DSM 765]